MVGRSVPLAAVQSATLGAVVAFAEGDLAE